MVYKDMTFCKFYSNCITPNCKRHLTAKVIDYAKKTGYLISQFSEKPECHRKVNNEYS